MKSRPRSSTRYGRSIVVLSLVVLLADSAAAQSSAVRQPRLEARPEARAFADAGVPTWEAALRLALWASTDAADVSAASAVVSSSVADLVSSLASVSDGRARAEETLRFMHRRFLRAYSERQTRMDILVASGTFNCVSSAALYLILGTAVGLDVSGVVTKDHAFCSVRFGEETVDVETTNVFGFDPGSKKEFLDSFGRSTGFAYVSPRNYRDRTPIKPIELLSLILSNRTSDLESAGRFSESVGLAVDRWTVLGEAGEVLREELFGRLANYGASLAKAGDEAAALDWVARVSSVFGGHPRLDELSRSAANNLMVKRLRRGDIVAARSELERYRSILTPSAFREIDRTVADAELLSAAENAAASGDQSRFLALSAALRASGTVSPERVREIELYEALKAIERTAATKGWSAALAETERTIARLGPDRKLDEARRVYRNNRVAELHNEFAVLFNARKFAAAEAAASAALSEFPDEPRLRADASLARKSRTENDK